MSLTPNQPEAPAGFDVARDGIERGKVTSFEYKTQSTGETYRASIYTPPGFAKEKKYPVLYLLHGASGDENTWVKEIHADAILDNLYASKKLVPMIVVMPSSLSVAARSREDKSGEDSSREGRASANMAFSGVLLNDLIPYVESKLPVIADRKHRALAGLSMGAGLALNTGLTNSTEFAWVGAFSGSGTRRLSDRAKLDLAISEKQPQFLWLSVGDRDGLMKESMVDTGTFLTERRVPYVFCINSGGHEPKVWMNDLYYFAPRLFRK